MTARIILHDEKNFKDPNLKRPDIIYGENLVREATNTTEKYVVVTMKIPWDIVKDEVVNQPEKIVFVPDMNLETMRKIEAGIPDGLDMVMGIGGGSSHDCAKYIGLKKNLRIVQIPTIFGGDAVVCTAIGVRKDGKVKYIGHTRTDKIYIDFPLIRKAPEKLVRYGAADILSSYTAVLDWEFAARKGKDTYKKDVSDFAIDDLLERLKARATDIKNLTDEGIKTIVELFWEHAKLAHQSGSIRAQEGSEHFFAYNAEYTTGKTYVHGAILSLGIWVSAAFFHNRKEEIEALLDSMGLEYSLESAGLSEDDFRKVLLSMDSFTSEGGYFYSIFNEAKVDGKMVDHILAEMKKKKCHVAKKKLY